MERSEQARRAAHRAYERAQIGAALRGLAVAAAVTVLAIGLHRTADGTWIAAAMLGASLAALGWRGGAWRRGALAGVVAGLTPLVAPSLVFAFMHGGHCATCDQGSALPCVVTCFGTSSLVGCFVGHRATLDRSAVRFAAGALSTAVLTGLLGCGTIGLGGAVGIAIGLVAGALTGWLVGGRTAHV